MLNFVKKPSLFTAVGLTLVMVTGSAFADKPHWKEGKHNHKKYESQQDKKKYKRQHEKRRSSHDSNYRFQRKDRQLIYSYFGTQKNQGKCPPGLAKKNNGCLPPGQYKKWKKGQPLSKQVRYYELPRELRYQLSSPYDGYRYMRVDDDVLLVNLTSNVVVDIIENILR